MMQHVRFVFLTGFLTLFFALHPALAQRAQFRGSQANFGVGVGLFTYHGRINLNETRSDANFTRSSDPAAVLYGSFPIIRDRLFFRGMAGLTNLNSLGTRGTLSTNEFLNRELFWFEPQVVFTPKPGTKSLVLPFVYTGFGSLIADPFGGPSSRIDQPNGGTPGPDRSVFTLPIGAGIDYPVGPYLSLFADVSFRINFNYVGKNATDRNPHNTSLVMFGVRFRNPSKYRQDPTPERIPPADLPDPIDIPPYTPPTPAPDYPDDRCVLVDLNTVYFASQSATVDPQTLALLDENVEALQLSPACCALVVGFTEGANTEREATQLSRERATFVFDYYTERGIAEHRLAMRARGEALPCLRKEDPECRINRRVESDMLECTSFPGFRE